MVPKESRKISNQFRERVKMEREREWTHAKIFEVEMFFSSKRYPFLYFERLSKLFSFSFFSILFLFLSLFFQLRLFIL
jgi:hypothetical protein